jgi:hypothetical protein
MRDTVALRILLRGFIKLNLWLSPLTLMLLGYLGIMGGSAPNAEPKTVFTLVAASIYLLPAAVFVAHLVAGKLVDAVFLRHPWRSTEFSWLGLVIAAVLAVVAGNIWVDDLYQFRQGNYGLSLVALALDVGALVATVVAGGGRVPGIERAGRQE